MTPFVDYYVDRYWNELPAVLEHLCRRATGDATLWWMDYLRKRYASRPFSRALVVGCGTGWVERDLFDRGVATRFDAFDVSEQYLAVAEAHRGSRDIRYFRSDFATFEPDGRYDLIVNVAALHHAQRLHGFVRKLAQAAEPDGIFVNWDYVGPSRNQYPAAQIRLMREVNESLPHRFRSRYALRPSLRQMLATDPTEAVHSAEIIDAVSAHFELVERRDLGGGIAYPLLWNNLAEFEKADEDARRTLERLLELDWSYTRDGRVATLFSFFIGVPRARPQRRAWWADNVREPLREGFSTCARGAYPRDLLTLGEELLSSWVPSRAS